MEILEVKVDFEERGHVLIRSIINLIEFESPRFLIKEVGTPQLQISQAESIIDTP